jgi:hypothetical protein
MDRVGLGVILADGAVLPFAVSVEELLDIWI